MNPYGFGIRPGANPYPHVDLKNREIVGQPFGSILPDGQNRHCMMTGLPNHGSAVKANAKEAVFDAIALVPGGGLANVARGAWNFISGLGSGDAFKRSQGFKQLAKGALCCIPGVGQWIAGASLAKNSIDVVSHSIGAASQYCKLSPYGGRKGLEQMVMQQCGAGMAMGAGGYRSYGSGYGW